MKPLLSLRLAPREETRPALHRQFREVLEYLQSVRLALLRVELRGVEIVAPDHRAELTAVVRLRGDHFPVDGHDVIGVDEVEEGTLLNALELRGLRYGCASICIGGGEAAAMIVERVG